MAGKPKITLYTDVISPFAYLAFHVLTTSSVFKRCEIEVIPVFLGGIMEATGNRPPLVIKNKGEYLGFERVYWAKKFGLEFADKNPEPFPQNTVHTMRVVCAVRELKPEKYYAYIAALYRTFFLKLEPISKPEVFGRVLVEVLGDETEAKKIIEHSTTSDNKDVLKKGTQEAIKSGAFGLPWYVAENAEGKKQGFWGISHLGLAVEFLGLDASAEPALKPKI